MPDIHAVLFDYHGIPVYVRLGLGSETPETARFMGPKGVLEANEYAIRYTPQTGEDNAPSYYSGGFPRKMRDQYVRQWHAEHDPRPGHEPIREDTVYRGEGWDEVRPHLLNFFASVRTRKPVVEDAVFGNHAAIACHMANEAYFQKKTVYWDEAANRVTA
jgi:hypothetical protein